jgi:hypothetical protein
MLDIVSGTTLVAYLILLVLVVPKSTTTSVPIYLLPASSDDKY